MTRLHATTFRIHNCYNYQKHYLLKLLVRPSVHVSDEINVLKLNMFLVHKII